MFRKSAVLLRNREGHCCKRDVHHRDVRAVERNKLRSRAASQIILLGSLTPLDIKSYIYLRFPRKAAVGVADDQPRIPAEWLMESRDSGRCRGI